VRDGEVTIVAASSVVLDLNALDIRRHSRRIGFVSEGVAAEHE
jgi:hypothetical protein